MRTGLIAKKVGMTQIFTESGRQVPVTVLCVEKCAVLGNITEAGRGYNAVKLGARVTSANRLSKPLREDYAGLGIAPHKISKEFRVDGEGNETRPEIGTILDASFFKEGQQIDVTGISKGKGFAGAMKRHGFGGLRATHGVSISHRSHGSTGNRTEPGRVFKNKRMAGHMGNVRVTTLNLTVFSVDSERSLLFVKGCVPGCKGGTVFVRDAIKIKGTKKNK
ncbi:MAG: 50S ribosomal protein L3 [Holosporales bacterium]|jgi:large subunit ribosomal protein L3|nr:50S ribosomal protein L3 [Holosporales bacterium]